MRIDSSLARAFSPGFVCIIRRFRGNSKALTNINRKKKKIDLDEKDISSAFQCNINGGEI